MKVDLLNLGDGPRVFYDRRGLPVVVGVGKIVHADMTENALRTIGGGRDTVVVTGEGEGVIPTAIAEIVSLLATLDFEEYGTLLRRFNELVTIDDPTKMRPTRQQMRVELKNKVEDFVRETARKTVHDDVDPAQLEKERQQQEAPPAKEPTPPAETQPPIHALQTPAVPARTAPQHRSPPAPQHKRPKRR